MSVFNNNELIMYQQDGKIMSGGYTVNSILMNSGKSPLNTYHYGGSKSLEGKFNIDDNDTNKTDNEFKTDQNTNNMFKDLAVPIGIFYINNDYVRNEYDKMDSNYSKCDMLSDEIYDKLFELASFKQPKASKTNKATRKNGEQNLIKQNKNKKTKRVKI
jgi:hypothetical protein